MLKSWALIITIVLFIVIATNTNAEIYTSISGKVIAEDTGKGIPGVGIVAERVEDREAYYATTDSEGKYILKDLKPGNYTLSFYEEHSIYISVKNALKVYLPKGKNLVNVNNILKVGGGVSGVVYNADGTPVSEALISAEVPDARPEWVNSVGQLIDRDGKFLLLGVPESDHCVVKVELRGHAPLSRIVKIQKGKITENVNFTVRWDEKTGISGKVISTVDNKPLKGIWIALFDRADKGVASTTTNEMGEYSIVGVQPGVYNVVAFWPAIPPKPEDMIKRTDVVIEKDKMTVLNFEFNKPAPENRIEK